MVQPRRPGLRKTPLRGSTIQRNEDLRIAPGSEDRNSIQIAIRLPEDDLKQARKIATRKGIGYQTPIKMLVHEGLQREAEPPSRSYA